MSQTELSKQQEDAVRALISQPTVTAAADQTGVNRRTLYRWLADPDFKSAYQEARRAVFDNANARLQLEAEASVNVLAALRDNPNVPASTRLSAAAKILDLSHTAVDLDDIQNYLDKLKDADDG